MFKINHQWARRESICRKLGLLIHEFSNFTGWDDLSRAPEPDNWWQLANISTWWTINCLVGHSIRKVWDGMAAQVLITHHRLAK